MNMEGDTKQVDFHLPISPLIMLQSMAVTMTTKALFSSQLKSALCCEEDIRF